MRTIQEFVDNGMTSVADLQDALKLAMQLEFSTIPPYLCAQWSIDPATDPAGAVAGMIQTIVVQEMFHFALAGNMLTAIGGVPNVANALFIPKYPTHKLPGDIDQQLAVDLLPLTTDQLAVFMQIELPEFPPVKFAEMVAAKGPATIGEFYTSLADGFASVNPPIVQGALMVNTRPTGPILTIDDAIHAIHRVQMEGEGTPASADQVVGGDQLAHYYVFKGIHDGKALDTGTKIVLPKSFPFPVVGQVDPAGSKQFNQMLTKLLQSLQNCWVTPGQRPDTNAMDDLEDAGVALIMHGIQPQFLWDSPS
jgi:hypothetical protein